MAHLSGHLWSSVLPLVARKTRGLPRVEIWYDGHGLPSGSSYRHFGRTTETEPWFSNVTNSYKFHKFVFYTQLQPSLTFVLNWCSHFMFAPRTLDLGDKSPSVAATSMDGDLLTPAGSAVETAKHRCSGRTWKCSCRAWWRRFRFLGKTHEDFGGLSSSPLLVDD